jgi:hypothetical protein
MNVHGLKSLLLKVLLSLLIANYFLFLENKLDTHNFRAIMVGDINTSGFDWIYGMSLPNSHYYSKFKGDEIYTYMCLPNLSQSIDSASSSNLLHLIFPNLSDLRITRISVTLDL